MTPAPRQITTLKHPRLAQRVAVPAYAYPYPHDAYWQTLLMGTCSPSLIVVDPADGPGPGIDPNYTRAIHAARRAGIAVLGYVTVAYGARSWAQLAQELECWYRWYTLDGVFVDQVPAAADGLHTSLELYAAIKRQTDGTGRVVLNPGTQTVEEYMQACDVLLNCEATWATYERAYPSAPAWVASYPAHRFWHLVHACPTEANMRAALWLARTRNAGWVFVTDWTGANAYAKLPSEQYLASEVQRATQPGDPRHR